ncbi:MAG: winged helix-turn-helix transcriptional regulator [candidate division Zixibacteria bacterium]|nr:winged helix-turn-helix transcriptional regulator [candidate division Zixibacteria bacterium]
MAIRKKTTTRKKAGVRKTADKTGKRTAKTREKVNTEVMPNAFRALSDPTRLKMLFMLEGKPRTVGEIVDFFDLSQPTISRHLQTLTAAGLAIRTRKAQKVYYAMHPQNMRILCTGLAVSFPCCQMEVITISSSREECCDSGDSEFAGGGKQERKKKGALMKRFMVPRAAHCCEGACR